MVKKKFIKKWIIPYTFNTGNKFKTSLIFLRLKLYFPLQFENINNIRWIINQKYTNCE